MFKRSVATLASGALLAVLVMPSARAAGPDQLASYAAGSSATALAISLLDQELAFSSTAAAVSSEGPDDATDGPTAVSDGAALLLAGTAIPGGAPSQTPGGEPANQQCPVDVDLGDLTMGAADGLGVTIGCVNTAATVPDGAPTASSESDEVILTVNGLTGDVLDPIVQPLVAALTEALVAVDEGLLCADGGLLDTLGLCVVIEDTTQIDVEALVAEIIADIGELGNGLFTVAQIRIAPTLSTASATATDGVVARAGSTGVFVELFPGLASVIEELTGLIPNADVDQALLTVTLGNATAEVVRDPVTGAASPDASAAQLLGVNLTDSLGILSDLLNVQVPGLLDSLAEAGAALSCDGGALADILCIDLGAVNELDAAELTARGYDFGNGTVGREATAAAIAVLPILGEALGADSVLGLQLSQASAAANAIPAAVEPPPPPGTPRDLPRTGGTTSLPLVLALFAAATAGVAIIRRTRSV